MLWEASGQKNLSFMSNKKENEELQSRREFFKQAAKAALPVVGAAIMASVPTVIASQTGGRVNFQAVCSNGCTNQCGDGCSGSCKGDCKGSCKGDCTGSADGSNNSSGCGYGCLNTCSGGCQGTCYRSCRTGCDGYNYY